MELFDKEEPPVWKSADGRTGFIFLDPTAALEAAKVATPTPTPKPNLNPSPNPNPNPNPYPNPSPNPFPHPIQGGGRRGASHA